jgi:hypothetical protein
MSVFVIPANPGFFLYSKEEGDANVIAWRISFDGSERMVQPITIGGIPKGSWSINEPNILKEVRG